jgi:hypothetical protein
MVFLNFLFIIDGIQKLSNKWYKARFDKDMPTLIQAVKD